MCQPGVLRQLATLQGAWHGRERESPLVYDVWMSRRLDLQGQSATHRVEQEAAPRLHLRLVHVGECLGSGERHEPLAGRGKGASDGSDAAGEDLTRDNLACQSLLLTLA